jgi:antitoxin component of MazEF toxin-antitoxin module
MIKTLNKVGNSYAMIIDKPILELLNINPDTPLEIMTDGESLLIRPSSGEVPVSQAKKFIKKVGKNTVEVAGRKNLPKTTMAEELASGSVVAPTNTENV